MKKIIVTGGLGYIGSHTVVDLLEHGYEVVSVDSLINSKPDVLDGIEKITGRRIKNYQIDLANQDAWKEVSAQEKNITGIIHFAALKAVGESVEKPLLYYQNNIGSLIEVLRWMQHDGIPYIIFSSSCTVYGQTKDLPVSETAEFKPASSPYGRTKQIGEYMLMDCFQQSAKQAISLRYFNPAGAHESIHIGEAPFNPPLNLVPVLTETAIGKRSSMTVFGTNYPTRDGTCIRDYIHVMDIAHAHTLAIEHLIANKQQSSFEAFNLGMERGWTVLEVLAAFEKTNGIKINYRLGDQRPGDMAEIYADSTKAREILMWHASRTVDDILSTAWEWEKKRSNP